MASFLPTMPRIEVPLRDSTRYFLASHAARRRVRPLSVPLTVSPYLPAQHGVDLLLHLWHIASQEGTLQAVFGDFARSPSTFVQIYCATAEILVGHAVGTDWRQPDEVLGIAWCDDVVEGARARVNYYIVPRARHPHISRALGTATIDYLFVQRGFHMLWGLTPMTNRSALRFLRRMGFVPTGLWPYACVVQGEVVDALHSVLLNPLAEARGPSEVSDGGI